MRVVWQHSARLQLVPRGWGREALRRIGPWVVVWEPGARQKHRQLEFIMAGLRQPLGILPGGWCAQVEHAVAVVPQLEATVLHASVIRVGKQFLSSYYNDHNN